LSRAAESPDRTRRRRSVRLRHRSWRGSRPPGEAAALVLATDPDFQGVTELNPNLIGASAWWTADPIADGGFRITITKGWGDCPAGCISKHRWIFEVTAAGAIALVDQSGDAPPEGPIQP